MQPTHRAEPRRRWCTRLLALVGGVVASVGCGGPSEPVEPPRLVLLFATCTLNKDHLSPYDPSVPYTPNLQVLSEGTAVTALRHRAEASISGVSYASLFTGAATPRHGVFTHPRPLRDELRTVDELFAAAGYETLAYIGHHVTRGLGYTATDESEQPLRAADPHFREELARLQADPDARLFVVTNDLQLHDYYPDFLERLQRNHPEALEGRTIESLVADFELYTEHRYELQLQFEETRAALELSDADVARLAQSLEILYRSRVFLVDARLGGILSAVAAAGMLDEALIVFTADHGETLYAPHRDVQWGHSSSLASDVLDVPLVIHSDRFEGSSTYAGLTRSIDVVPTLVGLAGLEVELEGVDGVDLTPALLGREEPPSLTALSHTGLLPFHAPEDANPAMVRRFVADGRPTAAVALRGEDRVWTLAGGAPPAALHAYDLATDPEETRDLFDPEDESQADIGRRLAAYKARLVSQESITGEAGGRLEQARYELLKRLGYVR